MTWNWRPSWGTISKFRRSTERIVDENSIVYEHFHRLFAVLNGETLKLSPKMAVSLTSCARCLCIRCQGSCRFNNLLFPPFPGHISLLFRVWSEACAFSLDRWRRIAVSGRSNHRRTVEQRASRRLGRELGPTPARGTLQNGLHERGLRYHAICTTFTPGYVFFSINIRFFLR